MSDDYVMVEGHRARIGDIELFWREPVVDAPDLAPVVLVHSGPGLDGGLWFPWLLGLERRRLLAIDLRGHGQSGGGNPDKWSVETFAADLDGLAAELGLIDHTLLGHGFGALVVLRNAIDFPGRAARVVLTGAVSHAGAYQEAEANLARFEPESLRSGIQAAYDAEREVSDPEQFGALFALQTAFQFADPAGAPRRAYLQRARSVEHRVPMIRRFAEPDGLDAFDVRDLLSRVSVPALVATGTDDRIATPNAARELATALPRAELALIEGAGHVPYVEQPEIFLATLRSFLTRHGG